MAPLVVGPLNVQLTVRTIAPPCSTVIVALVNDRSVMSSLQFGFGQSGAPGTGVTGDSVVTLNETLPFLISSAGIDWLPDTETGAGFCPRAWVPPWFVHVAVALAVAERVMSTSSLPRPASDAAALRRSPWSRKAGSELDPPLR